MKTKKKLKYNIPESEVRTYNVSESCVFKKNNDKFGGLSNMSTKFPVSVNGCKIRTVEALYQAMRFPNNSEVQKELIAEASPMKVKMISQKYKALTRTDWDSVRVKIMKWCLNVKYAQNIITFSEALNETNGKYIVENSSSDNFWGAIPNESNTVFVGKNALGRLLMDLRDKINSNQWLELLLIAPPDIENLALKGVKINTIDERANFINSLISYWSGSKTPVDKRQINSSVTLESNFWSNLGLDFNRDQINLF
jgi:ribA/ribD-fused uncharacterized protein